MPRAVIDDALWTRLEPLLLKRRRRNRRYAGRKPIPDRAVLTGIRFVLRSGIPWNMLPPEMGCGSGTTRWRRLVRWQRAGVWKRLHRVLLDELRHEARLNLARAVVDSASPRAVRGGKNWTEPYRSPQGRVEASSSHRRERDSARRDADGRQPARCHPVAAAGGRDAPGARAVPADHGANPGSCKPIAPTIRNRIATSWRRRASCRGSPSAGGRMAAASAAPAGSSSAPSLGCTAFGERPSATSADRVFTRRFSR